jgi:hypothetical protein
MAGTVTASFFTLMVYERKGEELDVYVTCMTDIKRLHTKIYFKES